MDEIAATDRPGNEAARGSPPTPPPAVPVAPPPPLPVGPPPPAPPDIADAFGALTGQGRAVLARLDPTGWRPTLIVAGVMVALVFGSLFLNALIPVSARPGPGGGPGPGPVTPGRGVELGNGVFIHPPTGWIAESGGAGQIRLQQGLVVVDVRLESGFQGDAAGMVDAFVRGMQQQASQFTSTPVQIVQLAAGAPGARAAYSGIFPGIQNALEGQVTGVILQGRPLLFDAYAPQGQLASAASEITTLINTVEVR